jgi:hypothetical protein
MKKFFILIIALSLFQSCFRQDGQSPFKKLEDNTINQPVNDPGIDGPIVIEGITPDNIPVYVGAGFTTFAVQIEAGAGSNVKYDFRLNGVSVQNTTAPFYVLNGVGLPAGTHNLTVEAKNGKYNDSHTFNLYVNTPPSLSITGNTPTTISCITGSFTMNVSATDVDGDSLSFSYYLNGNSSSAALVGSTPTATTATAVFTPNCTMTGVNNVKIRVTDSQGAYAEQTIAVTVSNPAVASISSYSPIASPVIVNSTGSQQFIISPDGTPPYATVWTITPGGIVTACNNQTSCTLDAGGSYVGSHTLEVVLTDNNSTSASQTFNIIFNSKHTLSSTTFTPTIDGNQGSSSTGTTVKLNCNDSVQYSVTSNDQNFGDAGQTHNITWQYGGVNVTDPSISSMFNVVKNIASNPVTSNLTFTPNCNASALQGEKEIKVTVTDGLENTTHVWDTSSSYLSTACLNLGAGEICTIAGRPGRGSGVNVQTEPTKVRIQPTKIIQGPDPDTYFITDRLNGTVWFYNDKASGSYDFKSCESNSCANTTGPFKIISVGPKTLTALVGTGLQGTGSVGEISTDFYLNNPRGIAWDNTNKVLYIADFTNNRIINVDFNTASDSNLLGRPQIFGGQCAPIGSCTNTTAVTAASSHKCTGVNELVLNGSKLYAACFSNPANEYSLKVFDTVANTGQNLLRVVTATNPPVEGALDGTATSHPIYALIKHPTEDALIASIQGGFGNLLLINISGSPSFFGGTVAPGANSMMRLTRGTTATNTANNKAWNDTTLRLRAHAIYPRIRSSVLEGFYLVDFAGHQVAFLNTSGSAITIGNVSVANNFLARIWGNAAGLLRPANNGNGQNIFNNPFGLIESATRLIIADEGNSNLTALDTYATNGATSNLLTSNAQNRHGGFDGDADISPNLTRLNDPTSLYYSEIDNKLYITDVLNYRIRSIDLNVGTLKTEISNGASVTAANLAGDNLFPNANGLHVSRDLYKIQSQNTLLYVGSGGNTHHVRAYNQNTSGSFDTIFNTDVNIGRLTTVVGRNNTVAAAWNDGTMAGLPATDTTVRLSSPWGLVVDGLEENIYIANNGQHCILNVDSDGNIWRSMGTCGTAYNNVGPITDGDFATARFFNPRDMELDPLNKDYGNFFVVDGGLNTAHINSIRYANLSSSSITIRNPAGSNINIPAGQIRTITSGIGLMITGVAAFENWICYSQGYNAANFSTTSQKVVCFDRTVTNIKTFGLDDSIKGKIPLNTEQEGIDAEDATFAEPSGLTFDSEGNLYIAERKNNVIRMIKRWMP